MLRARKKNRVVRIPDEKAKEYEKLGYIITDENGKTIYAPEDKDATIAALRKENQKLKQQLAEKDLLLSQQKPGKVDEPTQEPEKPAEETPAADTGKVDEPAQEPEKPTEEKSAADTGKADSKPKGKGAAKKK